jgi:hypothetical protein
MRFRVHVYEFDSALQKSYLLTLEQAEKEMHTLENPEEAKGGLADARPGVTIVFPVATPEQLEATENAQSYRHATADAQAYAAQRWDAEVVVQKRWVLNSVALDYPKGSVLGQAISTRLHRSDCEVAEKLVR